MNGRAAKECRNISKECSPGNPIPLPSTLPRSSFAPGRFMFWSRPEGAAAALGSGLFASPGFNTPAFPAPASPVGAYGLGNGGIFPPRCSLFAIVPLIQGSLFIKIKC